MERLLCFVPRDDRSGKADIVAIEVCVAERVCIIVAFKVCGTGRLCVIGAIRVWAERL